MKLSLKGHVLWALQLQEKKAHREQWWVSRVKLEELHYSTVMLGAMYIVLVSRVARNNYKIFRKKKKKTMHTFFVSKSVTCMALTFTRAFHVYLNITQMLTAAWICQLWEADHKMYWLHKRSAHKCVYHWKQLPNIPEPFPIVDIFASIFMPLCCIAVVYM